ncbi:MAG TPA: PKD domain-containing protein, partial [Chitinophagaceae bacterium]|nr:PKD domain-containing protein [Chitinophagaceae bacterium]
VNVLVSPVAKFGYSRNICAGDSVLFRDSSTVSTGSIVSWQWNFGDATTSTLTNNNPFYHTYSSAGNYLVKLVVLSNNGCASDTFNLTVIVANKPMATISRSGVVCIDSLQSFISSFPVSTNPVPAWYWDFGDGQIFSSTTSNLANHSYTTSLTNITIKHLVSIGQGCTSDTAYNTIPAIYSNPVASFTMVADTACVNKPVQFNSTNTGISSWNWNFGNGSGNNTPPFTHSYATAGNYNISLKVTSIDGCSSAPVSQSIAISPNPLINAGPDKFIVPNGDTQINAINATPGNFSYTWTPSLGLSSSNTLNPIASPGITTEYMITAVDIDNNCMANDKVIVSVITGLYVPTAFTPNGDGKNDKWQISGLAVHPDAMVTIYNRWGQIIYQAKDYYNNPWDGKLKGVAQPTGTFVYLIKLNDAKGQILKGTVTIIR